MRLAAEGVVAFFLSLALIAGAFWVGKQQVPEALSLPAYSTTQELDMSRLRVVLYDPEARKLYNAAQYRLVPMDLPTSGGIIRILVLTQ